MSSDCKSVIRGFESHLGLSKNTPKSGGSARNAPESNNRELPPNTLTDGVSGCGLGCGKFTPVSLPGAEPLTEDALDRAENAGPRAPLLRAVAVAVLLACCAIGAGIAIGGAL
jgi:hypothetical protein